MYKNYRIMCSKSDVNKRYLYDGHGEFVFTVIVRDYDDYVDEVIQGNNECAVKHFDFETPYGSRYVCWQDIDTDEIFISKMEQTK